MELSQYQIPTLTQFLPLPLLRLCQHSLMSPQAAHHSAMPRTELSTSMVSSGPSLIARLAAAEPTVPSLALRTHARISQSNVTRRLTTSRLLTWVAASVSAASHDLALMLSSQHHQHAVHARSALLLRPRTSASHTHTLVSARNVQRWANSNARLHTIPLSTGWTTAARLSDVASAPPSHAQLNP